MISVILAHASIPPLPPTLPFWLHVAVESLASLNFMFNPAQQLPSPAPQAHAIIRQYATLLLASSFIALVFARREVDATSQNVAGALALYHLAPLMRAFSRVVKGEAVSTKGLGGPLLHASVHGGCFVALMRLYLI